MVNMSLFLSHFSSEENNRGLSHAVDYSVYGAESRCSCTPLLHHDCRPVCELRDHGTKAPSGKVIAPRAEFVRTKGEAQRI